MRYDSVNVMLQLLSILVCTWRCGRGKYVHSYALSDQRCALVRDLWVMLCIGKGSMGDAVHW
jgi:hypothetical protein